MALRNLRYEGDPILTKVCHPVKEMTPRLQELADDMLETMYDAGGVGLAACQVGILRRIVVIDTRDGQGNGEGPFILVNPVITESDGEQRGQEGCLSVPDKVGIVTRPMHVIAEAYDRQMQPIRVEGEGLLARAICHELDHLDGHMYTEKAEGPLIDLNDPEPEEDEEGGDAE